MTLLVCVLYAAALIPGLPLGFALFGRRHAGGWISGAALGYFLTSIALWIPIRAGAPSAVAFVLSWIAVSAIAAAVVWKVRTPVIALPSWTRRDSVALALVLTVVLAIAVPPFAKVGATDQAGNRYYRAYFTADFVWHEALTAELAKFASPPRNPYLAARPVHYYWTYFLLPSAIAGAARAADRIRTCLEVNAIATAMVFASAIFLAAWTAIPRAGAVAAAILLAIVASSAEGLYAIGRLWSRGVPLGEVRNLNVDALANWWFAGLRIDGLQRCFWWVPQHSMAYALGLVALAVVNASGSAAPLASAAIAGIALAGSVAMNPFVGGTFALAYGAAVAIDATRSADFVRRCARHAITIVPVALALLWCTANQMVEGAGGALQIGWLGDARNAPLFTLLLSLGPALIPAVAGLIVRPDSGSRPNAFAAPIVLAGLSLLLMYFVRLRVDSSWVGFRAGQMFLVAIPPLAARGLTATGSARRLTIALACAAFVAGIPTTAIDVYNAQDISNVSAGPIGPWTIVVSREQQAALDWIRSTTPAASIVQMDPTSRQRQTWSLIPSVAERRMAAGLPISLLDVPEYHEKSARVKSMYETSDARDAWSTAHALRINFIYVDRVERAAYPAGSAKFDRAPDLFRPVFRNEEVTVYRVE